MDERSPVMELLLKNKYFMICVSKTVLSRSCR